MDSSLYQKYDDLLIGRDAYMSPDVFSGREAGGENEKRALALIRYAMEDVLLWYPWDAVHLFDDYIVDLMKLKKIISYISFPPMAQSKKKDYILYLLYPELVHMDADTMVSDLYDEILAASNRQFPKEYFANSIGFERFCRCLRRFFELYTVISSTDEYYRFLHTAHGMQLLFDKRLKVPAELFCIDLNDAVHAITRDAPDSELYYNYWKFHDEYDKVKTQ